MKIPYDEFKFIFSRSGGAGGQNVNKVNSKVLLIWNLQESSSISDAIKLRFKAKYPNLVLENGEVQIVSQKTRNQKDNINDCIEKLHVLLSVIEHPPKVRKKTRPKRSAIEKRLTSKKLDSLTKRMRKKDY